MSLLIGLGILAVAFFLLNSQRKSIGNAIDGLSDFGKDTHGVIFPEPAEQQARNEKGAIGNTNDYLFGEGKNKIIQDSGIIPTIYGGLFGAGSYEAQFSNKGGNAKKGTIAVTQQPTPAIHRTVSLKSTRRQQKRGSVFG